MQRKPRVREHHFHIGFGAAARALTGLLFFCWVAGGDRTESTANSMEAQARRPARRWTQPKV